MRVYGLKKWVNAATPPENGDRQVWCVVAAQNQKEAAKLFNVSVGELRHFGGQTTHSAGCEAARRKPGTVFYQDHEGDNQFHEEPRTSRSLERA